VGFVYADDFGLYHRNGLEHLLNQLISTPLGCFNALLGFFHFHCPLGRNLREVFQGSDSFLHFPSLRDKPPLD